MKKLYEIKNNTRIDVSHLGLVYENGEHINELNFLHVDGMYSVWTDEKDNIIHLSAFTDVKEIDKQHETNNK